VVGFNIKWCECLILKNWVVCSKIQLLEWWMINESWSDGSLFYGCQFVWVQGWALFNHRGRSQFYILIGGPEGIIFDASCPLYG